MRDYMRDLCIHHHPCLDGYTSAWVVNKALGSDVEFYQGVHGQPPAPIDVIDNRHILIVDFSYPRDILLEMAKVARSITILDHHLSAQRDLDDIGAEAERMGLCPIYVVFDMNRSGARLTWDYFFEGMRAPLLVRYVEDRDLWRFDMQDSRAVNANLFSHPYTFPMFDTLAEVLETKTGYGNFVTEGRAILRKQEKDLDELLPILVRPMTLSNGNGTVYTVKSVNLPYIMASEAAGRLAENAPFAVAYWDSADGRHFSLRSRKPDGVDVSQIAKHYGGGGHYYAAGFRVTAPACYDF